MNLQFSNFHTTILYVPENIKYVQFYFINLMLFKGYNPVVTTFDVSEFGRSKPCYNFQNFLFKKDASSVATALNVFCSEGANSIATIFKIFKI